MFQFRDKQAANLKFRPKLADLPVGLKVDLCASTEDMHVVGCVAGCRREGRIVIRQKAIIEQDPSVVGEGPDQRGLNAVLRTTKDTL